MPEFKAGQMKCPRCQGLALREWDGERWCFCGWREKPEKVLEYAPGQDGRHQRKRKKAEQHPSSI